MAEVEHEVGVRSTFYVMARSPFYNPFSHAGHRAVERIVELGHTLGIHCDLDEPRDSRIGPLEAGEVAMRDRALLAVAFPALTRRLSFHCPPDGLLWKTVPFFASAYGPEWQGRYFADSRGVFAYGDPEDRAGERLQVNLHAEHWFPDAATDHAEFWR